MNQQGDKGTKEEKVGKEGRAGLCIFKSDLTNESLAFYLHTKGSLVQVLVAGKFAIGKRRPQPRHPSIRSLSAVKDADVQKPPVRPAEALMPVCCPCQLCFPGDTDGSGASVALRKIATFWTACHPGPCHQLLCQPPYALMNLGCVK